MALSPTSCASAIMTAYRAKSAIGTDGKPTGSASSGNFPAAFAGAYDDYATAGIVPGATPGNGDPSIIQTYLAAAITNSAAEVLAFATALANYWAGVAVTPGTPANGGVAVVSVTNDALDHISKFQAAITASLRSAADDPGFQTLISNIQSTAVSAIIWTITEQMPDTSTQEFEEAIT